jgi:hypothetical protein
MFIDFGSILRRLSLGFWQCFLSSAADGLRSLQLQIPTLQYLNTHHSNTAYPNAAIPQCRSTPMSQYTNVAVHQCRITPVPCPLESTNLDWGADGCVLEKLNRHRLR